MATGLRNIPPGRPDKSGVAMASALTGRGPRRPDHDRLEYLSGQVLPVGDIREKVLAAHRYGLARVILPQQNQRQMDEALGDDLRRAVAVDYVARTDALLDIALQPAAAAGNTKRRLNPADLRAYPVAAPSRQFSRELRLHHHAVQSLPSYRLRIVLLAYAPTAT